MKAIGLSLGTVFSLIWCTMVYADTHYTPRLLVGESLERQGGREIRLPGFDLRGPGVEWRLTGYINMVFVPSREGEPSHYRLVTRQEEQWDRQTAYAPSTLPLLPNRDYLISILLKADFPRPAEINVGLRQLDGDGREVMERFVGLPNHTDGWQRWECVMTADARAAHAEFQIHFWETPAGTELCLADVVFVELPARPLVPYGRGEGASFLGGPGNLPMRVEEVSLGSQQAVVRTTGARYTFDLAGDTILAEQMLEQHREVALWRSSLPLANMEVVRQSPKECLLANDYVTVGIQCDSLVMVVPHAELTLAMESRIAGRWNRLVEGHLLVVDEWGGMAVNPAIPLGTGRRARVDAEVTPGRGEPGGIDFAGLAGDQTFLTSARPGWRLKYQLSPGERLAFSVFPPRPYPWDQSFEFAWLLAQRSDDVDDYPARRRGEWHCEVLWDFFQRSWAFSWGREHVPYDEDELRRHVAAIKAAGSRPVPYMSGWFYYSRDAAEFGAEVTRLRDTYGFEGVYYDGLPVEDWIVAYEEIRLTREAYPDGAIILHHTYPAPLFDPSIELPAISTYADVTYMGELVSGQGAGWGYPRWMVSQFRKANCIGVMKGDAWQGLTELQKDLLMLSYNGRNQYRRYPEEYYRVLTELQRLWRTHGAEPGFYERYYRPRVEALVSRSLEGSLRGKAGENAGGGG